MKQSNPFFLPTTQHKTELQDLSIQSLKRKNQKHGDKHQKSLKGLALVKSRPRERLKENSVSSHNTSKEEKKSNKQSSNEASETSSKKVLNLSNKGKVSDKSGDYPKSQMQTDHRSRQFEILGQDYEEALKQHSAVREEVLESYSKSKDYESQMAHMLTRINDVYEMKQKALTENISSAIRSLRNVEKSIMEAIDEFKERAISQIQQDVYDILIQNKKIKKVFLQPSQEAFLVGWHGMLELSKIHALPNKAESTVKKLKDIDLELNLHYFKSEFLGEHLQEFVARLSKYSDIPIKSMLLRHELSSVLSIVHPCESHRSSPSAGHSQSKSIRSAVEQSFNAQNTESHTYLKIQENRKVVNLEREARNLEQSTEIKADEHEHPLSKAGYKGLSEAAQGSAKKLTRKIHLDPSFEELVKPLSFQTDSSRRKMENQKGASQKVQQRPSGQKVREFSQLKKIDQKLQKISPQEQSQRNENPNHGETQIIKQSLLLEDFEEKANANFVEGKPLQKANQQPQESLPFLQQFETQEVTESQEQQEMPFNEEEVEAEMNMLFQDEESGGDADPPQVIISTIEKQYEKNADQDQSNKITTDLLKAQPKVSAQKFKYNSLRGLLKVRSERLLENSELTSQLKSDLNDQELDSSFGGVRLRKIQETDFRHSFNNSINRERKYLKDEDSKDPIRHTISNLPPSLIAELRQNEQAQSSPKVKKKQIISIDVKNNGQKSGFFKKSERKQLTPKQAIYPNAESFLNLQKRSPRQSLSNWKSVPSFLDINFNAVKPNVLNSPSAYNLKSSRGKLNCLETLRKQKIQFQKTKNSRAFYNK